jgi:hypothetical protein
MNSVTLSLILASDEKKEEGRQFGICTPSDWRPPKQFAIARRRSRPRNKANAKHTSSDIWKKALRPIWE